MRSLSAVGPFRKDVTILGENPEISYENIFRVYSTEGAEGGDILFYNLHNSVYLSTNLQPNTYYTITVNRTMPWTAISYNEYRTIDLWWLIVLANGINNPVKYPVPGTQLKIIKPEFVPAILNDIQFKLSI